MVIIEHDIPSSLLILDIGLTCIENTFCRMRNSEAWSLYIYVYIIQLTKGTMSYCCINITYCLLILKNNECICLCSQ